jgi:hypothetical protein
LALQKGKNGFGDSPYLNFKSLPTNKDQRLLEKIDVFFQQLIDACDGRHDAERIVINGLFRGKVISG